VAYVSISVRTKKKGRQETFLSTARHNCGLMHLSSLRLTFCCGRYDYTPFLLFLWMLQIQDSLLLPRCIFGFRRSRQVQQQHESFSLQRNHNQQKKEKRKKERGRPAVCHFAVLTVCCCVLCFQELRALNFGATAERSPFNFSIVLWFVVAAELTHSNYSC
jgi:hypothetical protein